jgi:hypothetical protein
MPALRSVGSLAVVLAAAVSAAATPCRRIQVSGQRSFIGAPLPGAASGLSLQRLGQVDIDVDGKPTPAVGWRIEADPQFLATIPRELLMRGADPASGDMTLMLRVPPEHPAVARIEAMIRKMFAEWSGETFDPASHPKPATPAAFSMGPQPDLCLDPCRVYSCDGAGDLIWIQTVGDAFGFIGNMGVTMFDLAVGTDHHLYGISGGSLYLINVCNAEVTLLGPTSLGSGLCGDRFTGGLFAQGPPLERIPLPATIPVLIGGSCCGPAPSWCGPSGDLTEWHGSDVLYGCMGCAGCPGDTLVSIDPATGAVIEEIACLQDIWGLGPIAGVTGIASTCSCTLLAGVVDSDRVLDFDPLTGYGASVAYGAYSGTFGFASFPWVQLCTQPPSCDPAAEPPACWSAQLHANTSDPDGDPLTDLWTTNCAGASFSPSATEADPLVTVDAGCRTCSFDLVVDDGNGGSCNDSVEVVFGGEAPVVEASALVSCLWPPNHGWIDVGLSATVSGGCGAPDDMALSVTSVTSDEPPVSEPGAGGPRGAPDAIVDGLTVLLRAERSGVSDGRVYRITVTATDPCGNKGDAVVEVHVPHDQVSRSPGRRRGHAPDEPCAAIDSGARYDATARN